MHNAIDEYKFTLGNTRNYLHPYQNLQLQQGRYQAAYLNSLLCSWNNKIVYGNECRFYCFGLLQVNCLLHSYSIFAYFLVYVIKYYQYGICKN